jgi:hypothetical protein
VKQDERALVREAQVVGDRKRALALDLIAEDRNGREIVPERALVAREQRSRRDREIF